MALTSNEGTKKGGELPVNTGVSEGLPLIKNNLLTIEEVGVIANKMLVHLEGLNKNSVDLVLEWIKNTVNSNYFLSNPNILRKS